MALILAYQIFYYGPKMRAVEELRRASEAAEMLAEQERQAGAAADSAMAAAADDTWREADASAAGEEPAAGSSEPAMAQGLAGGGLPRVQPGTGAGDLGTNGPQCNDLIRWAGTGLATP